MNTVKETGLTLARAREAAGLTQRALAQRAGTAQSVVARVETGQANPTLETLERLFAAAGRRFRLVTEPIRDADAVVDAYKRDVDRSLLVENLRRSIDDRLRLNADVLELTNAMRHGARRNAG